MCDNSELYALKVRYEVLMHVTKDWIDRAREAAKEAAKLKAQIKAEEGSRRLRLVK